MPVHTAVRRLKSFNDLELLCLGLIYQHRVLSTGQIHELLELDRDQSETRRLLARLKRDDHICATNVRQVGNKKLWFLSAETAKFITSARCSAEDRPYRVTPRSALAIHRHTEAINDVGISFLKAAGPVGDDCGPFSWRHEIPHRITGGRTVQTDAVLRYTETNELTLKRRPYFVEVDRASRPVEDLIDKLRKYADYHQASPPKQNNNKTQTSQRVWHESYPVFPTVLVVFTNGNRARYEKGLSRRVRETKASAEEDPKINSTINDHTDGIRIFLTTLDGLKEHGPLKAIFKSVGYPEVVNAFGETNQPN